MPIDTSLLIINNMKLEILKNSSLRERERKKTPIIQRLMNNIYKNPKNGCWEWLGYKMRFGHGKIGYRDKVYLTHRLSYEIYIGPIPKNMNVCHKCDNPSCINPDHLFLGTQLENIEDCVKKNRHFVIPAMNGENNPLAKLTNQQANEIRIRLNNGERGIDLAKCYNVSAHIVSRIRKNKTYKTYKK